MLTNTYKYLQNTYKYLQNTYKKNAKKRRKVCM